MVDYKESLIMLQNMSTIINKALTKEAAFKPKEKIEQEKKERAENAKERNSLSGQGIDSAKKFVRNLGNIGQDKDALLDQLFKTQQKLNETQQPAKRIKQLENSLEFHEEALEKAKIEHDKLYNQETKDKLQKRVEIETELDRLASEIKEGQNKSSEIEREIIGAKSKLKKNLAANPEDKEQYQSEVNRLEDDKAKQINKNQELLAKERELKDNLNSIKDDLSSFIVVGLTIKKHEENIDSITSSLSALKSKQYDSNIINQLEQQIDNIKTRLAELGVEEQDYKKPQKNKFEPFDTYKWIHGVERLHDNFLLSPLQFEHLEEMVSQGEGDQDIPFVISEHLLEKRDDVTYNLQEVERQIDVVLNSYSNSTSGLTSAQQKILVIMGNIRNLDELIETLNSGNKTPEVLNEIKENRIKREKEISNLNATAAQIPELKELFSKKLQLQSTIKPLNKAINQEKLIKEQTLNHNSQEVFSLLEEYYSNNTSYFYNAIAEDVAKLVEVKLLDAESQSNVNATYEHIINHFTILPDEEQLNLEQPGGIRYPEDLERKKTSVQIDVKKIEQYVNNMYRKDIDLHDTIIKKFAYCPNVAEEHELDRNTRLEKFLNFFAQYFFNYKGNQYTKGYEIKRIRREINTPAQNIVKLATNIIANRMKQIIAGDNGLVYIAKQMLKSETNKDSPEVAEIRKRSILALEKEQEVEIRKFIEELPAQISPERKQLELEQRLNALHERTQRMLSNIKLQDPMKISDIKETIKTLSKQREIMTGNEYNFDEPEQDLKVKLPSPSEFQAAITDAYDNISQNPGATKVQDPAKFEKLLNLASSIFKYVYETSENNGPAWMQVVQWQPTGPKNVSLKEFYPFLYEKAVKSKSGEGSILEYTYGKIGVMFKLQLNNVDPQMGTLIVSLVLKNGQNINSYGAIFIRSSIDGAGKITSKVVKIEPITTNDNGKIVAVKNNIGNYMHEFSLFNGVVSDIYQKYSKTISKREMLLDENIKQKIKLLATAKIEEWYGYIFDEAPEEQKEKLKEILSYETAEERVNTMYETMILEQNASKIARTKLLASIQKFAILASQ